MKTIKLCALGAAAMAILLGAGWFINFLFFIKWGIPVWIVIPAGFVISIILREEIFDLLREIAKLLDRIVEERQT